MNGEGFAFFRWTFDQCVYQRTGRYCAYCWSTWKELNP